MLNNDSEGHLAALLYILTFGPMVSLCGTRMFVCIIMYDNEHVACLIIRVMQWTPHCVLHYSCLQEGILHLHVVLT